MAAAERREWKPLRYVVGALCALVAAYASVVNIRWREVIDAFSQASVAWTAAAVGSVLLTLALVTWRWGVLLERRPERHWWVLWHSIVLGQAVNIVVPLRFGEGVRLAAASRGLDVPVGRVMVALALERALDVSAFAVIVMLLVVGGRMPEIFAGLLPAAVVTATVTLAAAVLFVRFVPDALTWLAQRVRFVSGAARAIDKQVSAMRDGWLEIRRSNRLTTTATLTALIPFVSAATNFLILRAFDLPVPVTAALVLLTVLQIGTAIVSVPGNVGVFHYLTIVTLAGWGVTRPTALAAAMVLHIVSLGPKVVLAAIAMPGLWGSWHLPGGSRS